MRFALVATCLWFTLAHGVSELPAREAIRLATAPALSPDGATLAFAWRGDIWLVPSGGGVARPWSTHPGRDAQPHFSPDGTRIAFTSHAHRDATGIHRARFGRFRHPGHVSFGGNVGRGVVSRRPVAPGSGRSRSFLHGAAATVPRQRDQACGRGAAVRRYGQRWRDLARWSEDTLHARGSGLVAQGISRERGQSDLALRYADWGVHQACRPGARRTQPAMATRREGILLCRRAKRQFQSLAARFDHRQAAAVDEFHATTRCSCRAFLATARRSFSGTCSTSTAIGRARASRPSGSTFTATATWSRSRWCDACWSRPPRSASPPTAWSWP